MQSRQLWNTGPLYMCAVGCCEVADACGVPCRLSLSRLFIYLLTYLQLYYRTMNEPNTGLRMMSLSSV